MTSDKKDYDIKQVLLQWDIPFCMRLRKLVFLSGMSLSDFSQRAGYKSLAIISRTWRNSNANVPPNRLKKIAEILGVPFDFLSKAQKVYFPDVPCFCHELPKGLNDEICENEIDERSC